MSLSCLNAAVLYSVHLFSYPFIYRLVTVHCPPVTVFFLCKCPVTFRCPTVGLLVLLPLSFVLCPYHCRSPFFSPFVLQDLLPLSIALSLPVLLLLSIVRYPYHCPEVLLPLSFCVTRYPFATLSLSWGSHCHTNKPTTTCLLSLSLLPRHCPSLSRHCWSGPDTPNCLRHLTSLPLILFPSVTVTCHCPSWSVVTVLVLLRYVLVTVRPGPVSVFMSVLSSSLSVPVRCHCPCLCPSLSLFLSSSVPSLLSWSLSSGHCSRPLTVLVTSSPPLLLPLSMRQSCSAPLTITVLVLVRHCLVIFHRCFLTSFRPRHISLSSSFICPRLSFPVVPVYFLRMQPCPRHSPLVLVIFPCPCPRMPLSIVLVKFLRPCHSPFVLVTFPLASLLSFVLVTFYCPCHS